VSLLEGASVKVCKIDLDHDPEQAKTYGISRIPTVLLFRGGQVVDRIVGTQPRARYEETLERALSGASGSTGCSNGPYRPFAGDFDGDGKGDIGLYEARTGKLHIKRGDGRGTFTHWAVDPWTPDTAP
jgi:thiol-disulfide isomerase/thioredoxin